MPMPSMRAENGVFPSQVCANTRSNRLLADVGMAGAVNQSTLMGLGERFFATPDHHHGTIGFEQFLFLRGWWHEILDYPKPSHPCITGHCFW